MNGEESMDTFTLPYVKQKANGNLLYNQLSSIQSLSRVLFCDPTNGRTPSFPVHHQLPDLTQTRVHQVGNAIQPSDPLSSISPAAFNLSSIRVFSHESVLCIRWPRYWSFSISSSSENSGLISFRMDQLDLLAIQGAFNSLPQHHNLKASILQCSSFLYSPTLTSTHDHWKNHRFDQLDLCWQSNVSAF